MGTPAARGKGFFFGAFRDNDPFVFRGIQAILLRLDLPFKVVDWLFGPGERHPATAAFYFCFARNSFYRVYPLVR